MVSKGQSAAIVMRQYGGREVLRLETVAIPSLQPNEIRIRSIASAVNHSDPAIRAGNWPIFKAEPFPYTRDWRLSARLWRSAEASRT
jgi:NADPH:quinone reductase